MSISETPESSSGDIAPTPWQPLYGEATKVVDRDGVTVAFLCHVHLRGRRRPEQVGAHARLIADAPKTKRQRDMLLKAAKKALSALGAASQGVMVDGEIHEVRGTREQFYALRDALAECEE